MAIKGKGYIVTLRRSPSMPVEAYYLLAFDEVGATRRAKKLCRAPNAVVLDVTRDTGC
jgi:hypothetical protein